MECEICYSSFDEALHLPRNLRCGHTFCAACLDRLLLEDHFGIDYFVVCPKCETYDRTGKSVYGFPVNRNLVEVLRKDRRAKMRPSFVFPAHPCVPPPGSDWYLESESDCESPHTATPVCLQEILRNHQTSLRLLERLVQSRRSALQWLTEESAACKQEQRKLMQRKKKLLASRKQIDGAASLVDFELPELSSCLESGASKSYSELQYNLKKYKMINNIGTGALKKYEEMILRSDTDLAGDSLNISSLYDENPT